MSGSIFLETGLAGLAGMTGSWTVIVLLFALYLLGLHTYRAFYHPLAAIPGPLLAKCSPLWLQYHAYRGDECSAIRRLHAIYGPVVRVAPNEVDIADGAAIAEIYSTKAGFLKSEHYRNFDVDGHPTIFTEINPAERHIRAKAVSSIFSTAFIRENKDVIEGCADKFVSRLVQDVDSGGPVDILNLARAFACDVTTTCLFQDDYGALGETETSVSLTRFMSSFVDVGRFYYLPPVVSKVMQWLSTTLSRDKGLQASTVVAESYLARVIGSKNKVGTFSDRLLRNGISESEAMAQSKDMLFAGTHLPGLTIATLCWLLARSPEKYATLRRESVGYHSGHADAQSLPCLQAAIKEAMRLSMGSPARLTRIVPESGMKFRGYHFPGGTNVGIGAGQLHLNPQVYPNPEEFIPERWENPTSEMQRDWIPFGMGNRACPGRGMATTSIFEAMRRIVEADVLSGAETVENKIETKEWFTSHVVGDRILLVWPRGRQGT